MDADRRSELREVDAGHAFSVWAEGLRLGMRCLRSDPTIGLQRLVLPVSYWRYAEFGYVVRHLSARSGGRVLDLGSPKDLAVFLARRRNFAVRATDILTSAIARSSRTAAAAGVAGDGPGRVLSEVADGRQLPYPTDAFDAAYSVSVLEHIPDAGDGEALRELVRVVRPGGIVIVTTPYDRQYRETFVDGPVYERDNTSPGQRVFFERHYDRDSLQRRLLQVTGTRLVNLELWGEQIMSAETVLSRLGRARTALSPLEALLGRMCLRRVDGTSVRPMAAFFTLQKTAP